MLGPEGHGHLLGPVWLGWGHKGVDASPSLLNLCLGHKARWDISQSWGQGLALVQGEANGPRGITNSGVTSDFSLH